MNNGILHKKRRLIYWFIPKNACTSLKKLIADDLGLSYANIHDAPFDKIPTGDAEMYDNYTHFTVIRNPFDRLLSCYLDKIRPGYRGRGFPKGVAYNFRPHGFTEDMTFTAFVSHIIDGKIKNPHWNPQSPMLPDVPMLVFRFENLSDELPEFLEAHGFKQELPHRNKSRNGARDYQEYYTPELRAKVRQYYLEDLKKFKYRFEATQ